MSNCCSFEMHVTGKPENIEKFVSVLRENLEDEREYRTMSHPIYRAFTHGGDFTIDSEEHVTISGCCAWSLASSWENKNPGVDGFNFYTMSDITKEFKLKAEAWSDESGCCFAEHYKWDETGLILDDCLDYEEDYDEEKDEFNVVVCPDGFYEFEF